MSHHRTAVLDSVIFKLRSHCTQRLNSIHKNTRSHAVIMIAGNAPSTTNQLTYGKQTGMEKGGGVRKGARALR